MDVFLLVFLRTVPSLSERTLGTGQITIFLIQIHIHVPDIHSLKLVVRLVHLLLFLKKKKNILLFSWVTPTVTKTDILRGPR